MSTTIWKYPFQVTDVVELLMPKGSVALAVQTQGDIPCLWAMVDPDADREVRRFRIYGTGHALCEDARTLTYVGTFQMHGGALVFHIFEAP